MSDNLSHEEKLKALELASADLDRQLGKNSVYRLGTDKVVDWPSISTGAFSVDVILGIGGLPKGRIVEIFGPESSGKSTICLETVANAQRAGGIAAFIDAEHSIDPKYAQALGVNMDDLWFSQPDYGEAAIDIATTIVRTGALDVLVIDSVAALTPKAELEGTMEDAQMGLQGRLMSKAVRRLSAIANKHNTLIIFTNQLREKIGIMFGNPEITPGGRALRFAASVRLDLRRKDEIKDKATGEVIGIRVEAKTPKNKMAPALKRTMFDIMYGSGIDRDGCILDLALEHNLLVKGGAWIKTPEGEIFAQGRDNAVLKLKEEPEYAEKLLDGVNRVLFPEKYNQTEELDSLEEEESNDTKVLNYQTGEITQNEPK